ncbi:hypothetical protein SBA2_810021 [Acidobacteriia bacterium SbA2]|nr:hypothetical protein SBA2_810021 [Acidobacteriia bacterium SbA2]
MGTVRLPPLPPNFPDDGDYYVFTQSYLSYPPACRRRAAQFRALDRTSQSGSADRRFCGLRLFHDRWGGT